MAVRKYLPRQLGAAAERVELWSTGQEKEKKKIGKKKLWVLITEPCNLLVEKLLGKTHKATVMGARVHV